MKLKSVLLTALLSFAITPLAMAMTGEELYLKGRELEAEGSASWVNVYDPSQRVAVSNGPELHQAAHGYYVASCNKNYVKGCERAFYRSCDIDDLSDCNPNSENIKYGEKACKLGKKEYCGLRQKIKQANEKKAAEERERKKAEERSRKALPIAERRLCEEMPEACPRPGEMDTIQGTPKVGEMKRLLRELHQEAIQELEDEEKFGKEEARKRREASKAKRQERRWCKAHPKECRRKQAEKAVKESTHSSPFGLGDHSESWSQRELKQSGNTCDKGEASACTSMARIYLDGGENVPRNIHKAVELFLKGCQSGDPWACQELGEIHAAGRYGKKADAPRFYQVACMVNTKTKNEFFSAKHGKSCQKLLK